MATKSDAVKVAQIEADTKFRGELLNLINNPAISLIAGVTLVEALEKARILTPTLASSIEAAMLGSAFLGVLGKAVNIASPWIPAAA